MQVRSLVVATAFVGALTGAGAAFAMPLTPVASPTFIEKTQAVVQTTVIRRRPPVMMMRRPMVMTRKPMVVRTQRVIVR